MSENGQIRYYKKKAYCSDKPVDANIVKLMQVHLITHTCSLTIILSVSLTTSRRPQSYRLLYRDTINTLIGPNFMALSYWSDITFQNRFYRDVQNISHMEYFQCKFNFFYISYIKETFLVWVKNMQKLHNF
jgi:hypothetical protein